MHTHTHQGTNLDLFHGITRFSSIFLETPIKMNDVDHILYCSLGTNSNFVPESIIGQGFIVPCYEARTLQSECRVRVEHVSDTDTCKTLARHVSDTLMLCRILNNHKITCRHCVQHRVDIK